jgi:hypothetical protein
MDPENDGFVGGGISLHSNTWADLARHGPKCDCRRDYIAEMNRWLAEMYKNRTHSVRQCVTQGILDQLLQNREIRGYFHDWRSDPELQAVYSYAVDLVFVGIGDHSTSSRQKSDLNTTGIHTSNTNPPRS